MKLCASCENKLQETGIIKTDHLCEKCKEDVEAIVKVETGLVLT